MPSTGKNLKLRSKNLQLKEPSSITTIIINRDALDGSKHPASVQKCQLQRRQQRRRRSKMREEVPSHLRMALLLRRLLTPVISVNAQHQRLKRPYGKASFALFSNAVVLKRLPLHRDKSARPRSSSPHSNIDPKLQSHSEALPPPPPRPASRSPEPEERDSRRRYEDDRRQQVRTSYHLLFNAC